MIINTQHHRQIRTYRNEREKDEFDYMGNLHRIKYITWNDRTEGLCVWDKCGNQSTELDWVCESRYFILRLYILTMINYVLLLNPTRPQSTMRFIKILMISSNSDKSCCGISFPAVSTSTVTGANLSDELCHCVGLELELKLSQEEVKRFLTELECRECQSTPAHHLTFSISRRRRRREATDGMLIWRASKISRTERRVKTKNTLSVIESNSARARRRRRRCHFRLLMCQSRKKVRERLANEFSIINFSSKASGGTMKCANYSHFLFCIELSSAGTAPSHASELLARESTLKRKTFIDIHFTFHEACFH